MKKSLVGLSLVAILMAVSACSGGVSPSPGHASRVSKTIGNCTVDCYATPSPTSSPGVAAYGGGTYGGCNNFSDGPLTNCSSNCSGYASGGVPNMTCDETITNGPVYDPSSTTDVGGQANPAFQDPYLNQDPNNLNCFIDGDQVDTCPDGTQVAEFSGPPVQGDSCASLNGSSHSLRVGDTVGTANVNGTAQLRSVKDINMLFSYVSGKTITPYARYFSDRSVGWVYEDNQGGFWFQKDSSTNWNLSFSGGVSLGSLISTGLSITPPTTDNPVPIGAKPGKIGRNLTAAKCFTGGAAFYPGTMG